MHTLKRIFLFVFLLSAINVFSQEKALVFGTITNNFNKPLDLVNISLKGHSGGTITNSQGHFEMYVPANKNISLIISFVGFKKESIKLFLTSGEKKEINKKLFPLTTNLDEFTVKDRKIRTSNIKRLNPKQASVIPGISGSGIESLIKTMPGVASNNELSSQYSVRGGNYDENLIYVNGIEIYRPFLIRSGQQEGLSFLNSDLVSSISFSAGGFEAKYGDKMSSVLDIKYKKPKSFAASCGLSLMGGSAHVEGASDNEKFTYLIGIRQKSNQYVLNSLETKGEYKPSFSDFQSLFSYQFNQKIEFSFLGYIAKNKYKLVPETRETSFGTINEAYQLKIYFDGQEVDEFNNYLGAFTTDYKVNKNLNLKFITSFFQTKEEETFDTQGQYWMGLLETGFGDDEYGNAVESNGVGTHINHARNYFDASIFNIEHKGFYTFNNKILQWGAKYQREIINDEMNEWEMIDSAGYSLPYNIDSVGYINPSIQADYPLILNNLVKANNNLTSNRYSGFAQNSWNLDGDSSKVFINVGLRAHYWDVNKEFLLSPRASISYQPKWNNDLIFKLSAGYYFQPPFYKELRNIDGNLNKNLKAQKSIHFVLGGDCNLKLWGRPFKYSSEIYYKHLDNLVPYEIDNVRIRYYSDQKSHGYATGIDMKINGEFVTGVESWASLSIMQTKEDIEGDFYFDENGDIHYPGYISRPTDQRVNFSLFFQDYLPKDPSYKMHLNMLYGSGLPFGPPDSPKYKHVFETPSFFRVDIGFYKQIIGEKTKSYSNSFLKHFKSLWLSLEIFNLLDKSNTISYIWVTDVSNREYAVPNYLTSRMLNFRLIAEF